MPLFWRQGFLGTRGSFMLDLVSAAMVAILALLAVSVLAVRKGRRYEMHRRFQLALVTTLAVTVVLFELDIRFVTDWQTRAEPSPYFERGRWNAVWYCLIVHLCCALPTALLWVVVTVTALRHFPRPLAPSTYSRRHKIWGWLAVAGIVMTAVTGWLFYGLAFVVG